MIRTETLSFWRLLVLHWTASSMYEAVTACHAHPTAVAVAVGDRVSLNCSADADFFVGSWQNGGHVSNKIVVYTAPEYGSDGSEKTPRFTAEGYSVDNPTDNQAILHINNISLSQAGTYYCTCLDATFSTASSSVVVLKPEFSVNSSATNEKAVSFVCNILSSEDISYVLTIQDMLGNAVAKKTGSSLCNDLTTCSVQHTVIANGSVDQSLSCNVYVTTKGNITFEKVFNASIECSSSVHPTGRNDSQKGEEEWNYRWIAIPIACVVVLALVAGAIVLLYRNRKLMQVKTATFRNRF